MLAPTPTPQPAGELHILIGGSIESCIGEVIGEVVKKHFGYARVTVRTIERLDAFLETATQSPPDLFLLYLYLMTAADEAVSDPAACESEILAQLEGEDDRVGRLSGCGLRLVSYLRAEYGKPVIVLTGCADAPGRATRVKQAGASAFLTLPFTVADCIAALGSHVDRRSSN